MWREEIYYFLYDRIPTTPIGWFPNPVSRYYYKYNIIRHLAVFKCATELANDQYTCAYARGTPFGRFEYYKVSEYVISIKREIRIQLSICSSERGRVEREKEWFSREIIPVLAFPTTM